MRMLSTLALAAAIGGMATATAPAMAKKADAPAADAKAPTMKPTPAVQKPAFDAQKATQAGDLTTALAKYNEAKAAITTDDDKYAVGVVGYQIYQKNQDQALFSDAIDLMLASGKATQKAQQQMYVAQGKIAYGKHDYARALTSFQAAQAAGSDDPDLVPGMVEAMSQTGHQLQALQFLNDAIAKRTAANQPVPVEWYQRGLTIGYRSKANPADLPAINAATLELSKKWVAAEPSPKNWNAALQIYAEQFKLDNDARVDTFRLLRAAGALAGDAGYREYAEDVYIRFPGEAQSVLQEGNTKGLVNLTGKNDATEVMGIVKAKVPADKASLPAADKSARAAATGKGALSTADAYTGYGDYAKAIDLYKVALAKGGVDAGTVNLHMGWAQALSGDTAGAKATFAAVTGSRKPTADFWVIHLDHPTVANAPAA